MTEARFSVRASRVADIPAFAAVERSAAERFKGTDRAWVMADAPTVDEVHRTAIAEGHHWLAEVDGEIAGLLLAERLGETLHLAELSVAMPFQGRGIGTALIAAAERDARNAAFSALTLTTYRDIAWNAPFYRRRGFAELGREAIPRHLTERLEREARAGHDPALRCAMIKPLR